MAKIDKILLYLHSEDARKSQPKIAGMLCRSPQIINYNIKRFEKEGAISSYYALIDYSYLGYLLFKVYFRGGYTKRSQLGSLIQEIVSDPKVTSVYEVGTEYDLLVEFMAANPSEFNKDLKKLISKHDILRNYDIIMNIVTRIYPRILLLPKNKRIPKYLAAEDIVVGGDRDLMMLSDNERNVLSMISTNPRMSCSALADSLGINIKTVLSVMRSLRANDVLKGFKASVDVRKMGMIRKKVVLNLHNVDIEKEQKLVYFCRTTPDITAVNKTLGKWDIEMDIEAEDEISFRRLYLKIREEFRDMIRGFNSYDIYKEYKHAYLPYMGKADK